MSDIHQGCNVYFGHPSINDPSYNWDPHSGSPFCTTYSFHNFTGTPITICQRNGMRISIPNSPANIEQVFIVRQEMKFSASIKEHIKDRLSRVTNDSPMLSIIKNAFFTSLAAGPTYGDARIILDYPITRTALETLGGEVYFSDIDILLSSSPPDQAPYHPYSDEGRMLGMLAPDPDCEGKVTYSIELIDNDGFEKERFINIANEVYKLKPRKDYTLRKGIYVVSGKSLAATSLYKNTNEVRRYECNDANFEMLGLYETFQQAEARGDVTSARNKELAELEHSVALAKKDALLAKEKFSMLEAERDEEKRKADAEMRKLEAVRDAQDKELAKCRERIEHEASLERMRVKDHYEDRSHQRKDGSEVLKVVPAIIVGIGTAILAFKSIFS